ncbi:MAG: hypothetical protein GY925_30415 [Actinomycetia bacterium]|nr:hypothetical protein [Actinomycetes bacterium]
MWICDECGKVAAVKVWSCPNRDCRATGKMRVFGSAESDKDHDLYHRTPAAKFAKFRAPKPPAGASTAVEATSAVVAGPPAPGPVGEITASRPSARATVTDWRAWAVGQGYNPAAVADLNKKQLRALAPAEPEQEVAV